MNNNTRLQFLEKVLTLTPTIDNPFDLLLFQELHVSMNQTTNKQTSEQTNKQTNKQTKIGRAHV